VLRCSASRATIFGFVEDDGERRGELEGSRVSPWYAAGRVQAVLADDGSGTVLKPAWRVEMSTDVERAGGTLELPGCSKSEWTLLPGCTLGWDELGACGAGVSLCLDGGLQLK